MPGGACFKTCDYEWMQVRHRGLGLAPTSCCWHEGGQASASLKFTWTICTGLNRAELWMGRHMGLPDTCIHQPRLYHEA